MATNIYEGMFIVDSNRWASNSQGISDELLSLLKNQGADVLTSRAWDERRLAYPIRGQRKALYWLSYFRVDGEKISEIERQCRLKDLILRHLIIKVDPKLVSHLMDQLEGAVETSDKDSESAPAKEATVTVE